MATQTKLYQLRNEEGDVVAEDVTVTRLFEKYRKEAKKEEKRVSDLYLKEQEKQENENREPSLVGSIFELLADRVHFGSFMCEHLEKGYTVTSREV